VSTGAIWRPFERVGRGAEGLLAYLGGVAYLTLDAVWQGGAGLFVRPRVKAGETFYQMVRLGVRAIPIITLVQVFVGMTLAFTLAPVLEDYDQLSQLPTVIAKAMFPQLGPLLASVVLTGFAGAAITAELGTMVVGEEIAALRTSAINPVRFLVVPRVIACVLMTVSLTVLANIVGCAGGALISAGQLGINVYEYTQTTLDALIIKDLITGLIKGGIYGFIIVMVSCYEGLSVTGGAGGVGRRTTSAVVRSIFLIIVANCAFTALFYYVWPE
jgi:phospholipid/cholesterol/gamma-HCH transport system permease protein